MEALLGVPDIMARYKVCRHTASKLMHQMRHLTTPRLMVTESAVKAWECDQMKKERSVIDNDLRIPRRKA